MEYFETFAECSIAFAGFGAVHAILQGSTGPRGALRAWSTVIPGALSFVLSILPPLLAQGDGALSDDAIWQLVSVVGVIAASAQTFSFVRSDIRLHRLGIPPQAPVFVRTAQAMSALALLLMLSNAVSWPTARGPFVYALGLLFVLMPGLIALIHSFRIPVHLVLGQNVPGMRESSPERADGREADEPRH